MLCKMMQYNFKHHQKLLFFLLLKKNVYFSSIKNTEALGHGKLSSLWKATDQHGWFWQGKTKPSVK